jgi:hypothetical protein
MGNPVERDTIGGVASTASVSSFKARRQGTLTRASDGFRSPAPAREPRRPFTGGREPDPPVAPYHYNPASPAKSMTPTVARGFVFLPTRVAMAAHVGFPDKDRTAGKLQASGEAWGRFGAATPKATPLSRGPRWERPASPKAYVR